MIRYFLALAVALLAGQTVVGQSALTDRLYQSVIWFHTSPEAAFLYEQGYDLAISKAYANFKSSGEKRPPAVILDIDETVLSNAQFEVERIKEGVGYTSENWKAWTDRAEAAPLPGALRFTHWADSMGIAVFYISNRKVNELESTITNLRKHGFPQVFDKHVLLRDKTDDKDERRASVYKEFDVILLVGDQLTDFSSTLANRGPDLGMDSLMKYMPDLKKRFVLLPNPMYGEWEKAIYGNTFKISEADKLRLQAKALGIE